MWPCCRRWAALAVLLWLSGCASPEPYRYVFVPGRTAELRDGYAIPPPRAPEAVLAAIAAGNRITGLPYQYGAGHDARVEVADRYDCSGAVSQLLIAAGLLRTPTPSRGFRYYGESGPGQWLTLYARRDHVFLVVAGLRFDTSYHGGQGSPGPAWATLGRPANGSVLRHPRGY